MLLQVGNRQGKARRSRAPRSTAALDLKYLVRAVVPRNDNVTAVGRNG